MVKTKDDLTKTPEDLSRFRDSTVGIARRKINIGTPEERVVSFLVQVAFDPETGDLLPAKFTPTDGMAEAIHQFKVFSAQKIFKL